MVPRSPCADQPYPVAASREDDRDDARAHQAIGKVAGLAMMVLGRPDLEHVALPDLLGVDKIDPVLGQVSPPLGFVLLELHPGPQPYPLYWRPVKTGRRRR
jgi:hypothetical protein